MDPVTLSQMNERVSQLLAQRLGARGHSLRERVESRARVLPRKVRRAAQVLIAAQAQAASPKMIRQVDPAAVARAYDTCVRHLAPLGAGARLRRFALSVVTASALGIVVIGALALIVARLRGLI